MKKYEQTNIGLIIIVVAVLVAGTLTVVWLARPSAQNQNKDLAAVNSEAADVFEISEQVFDFGEISMAAGKVSHVFELKNGGAESAEIERIYTSCMCTSAVLQKAGRNFGPFGMQGHGYIPKINQEFAPEDNAELVVTFDPAAHGPSGIGYIEREVYLETSVGTQEIMIMATVKP